MNSWRLCVAAIALSGVLAGCTSATTSSAIATPSRNASSFAQPNTGTNKVVYLSSFDGQPGVGQVFVYSADLNAHPSAPKRVIDQGTVRPYGMWVDSTGTLYIANIPNGNATIGITEYHPGQGVPFKTLKAGLWYPTEVAVGPDGTVYVNESLATGCTGDCVAIFKPGSSIVNETVPMNFTGYALQSDQMAFDRDGNLLVGAQTFQSGYHIFKMNVKTLKVTELSVDLSNIQGPGLAVDGAGNMYVSSAYTEQIAVFAPGAQSPTRWITPGAQDLTVTRDGTLYAMTGGGVNEYRPGSSSPDNGFNEPYYNQGFGIAIGPAH
jgi:sugar lactone lactonase YvrE